MVRFKLKSRLRLLPRRGSRDCKAKIIRETERLRAVEWGRGTDVDELSRPAPSGAKVAAVLRVAGSGMVARRPRTMPHPRRDSSASSLIHFHDPPEGHSPCTSSLRRGQLASHIPRGNRDVGGAGTATLARWVVSAFLLVLCACAHAPMLRTRMRPLPSRRPDRSSADR